MSELATIYFATTAILLTLVLFIVLLARRIAILEFRLMQMELIFAEFETHRMEFMLELERLPEAKELLQDGFLGKIDKFAVEMETIINT